MTTLFTLMTALGIDITPFQKGLGDADQTTKRTVPKITVTLDQVGQSAMRFGEHVMQVSGSLNAIGAIAEQSTNPIVKGFGETAKSAASVVGVLGNMSRLVGGVVNVAKDIGSAWSWLGATVIPMVQTAITAVSTMTLPQLAAAIWAASAPLLPWILIIGAVIAVFVLFRDTISEVVQGVIDWLKKLGGPFEWMGNVIQGIKNFFDGLFPSADNTAQSMNNVATSAQNAGQGLRSNQAAVDAAAQAARNYTTRLYEERAGLDDVRQSLLDLGYSSDTVKNVMARNLSIVNDQITELRNRWNSGNILAPISATHRGNTADLPNHGNIYDESTALYSDGGNRAGGGPVTAGKRYTVGEFGPEPFIPAVDGLILPNGFTGGQTNVTVVYQPMVSFADEEELARKLAPAIQNALRKAEAYG